MNKHAGEGMVCDKCGEVVPLENDAVFIESIASGNGFILFANQPRHFLPTATCEGSPSRAQYIEGQPRDTRGYPYIQANEALWREAYATAQVKAKAMLKGSGE